MIIKVVAAGVVAASFCLLFQVKGKNVLAVGVNGALGYLVYLLCSPLGELEGLFFSSAFMAFYAEVSARLRKAPAILFLSPALIPIVPGGGMFESALKVLQGRREEAVIQFTAVLLEAAAIALGIIVISSLIRLVGLPRGKACNEGES